MSVDMSVFVKFWGARGSIPTPGSWTRVYGGNTSCVEIRFDDTVLICDAGSGIRDLGNELVGRNPRPNLLHLLITHTHWDHIQGFPFFAPAHIPEMKIHLYGTVLGDDSRYQLLSGQMSSAYFPVGFGDLGAEIISDHLVEGGKDIEGVKVTCFPTNHPGGCFAYVFEKTDRKIVYLTDNEFELQPGDKFPDTDHTGPLRQVPPEMVAAVRGADLLICDAHYDDETYGQRIGWGHSSCLTVTDFAIQAEVAGLALFHHDPDASDEDVDQKVDSCRARAAKFGSQVVVFAAREGVELKI
jgi:phosphoribosyl 1,2-cyclic phosphodiesterase